jgi:hypothetical protein
MEINRSQTVEWHFCLWCIFGTYLRTMLDGYKTFEPPWSVVENDEEMTRIKNDGTPRTHLVVHPVYFLRRSCRNTKGHPHAQGTDGCGDDSQSIGRHFGNFFLMWIIPYPSFLVESNRDISNKRENQSF